MCAQFRALGGRALGIDHHLKRAKLKAAAVKLDLTAVNLGPPCGTASKARLETFRSNGN